MDSRIEELLVDWELAQQEGRTVSAEELCHDCPELLDDLKSQIRELMDTSWMFESQSDSKIRSQVVSDKSVIESQASCSMEEFTGRLGSSGLLASQSSTNEELSLASLRARFQDAGECAASLVEKSVLTLYQSNVLLGTERGPLCLDRYVVQEPIGRGGMGVVYRAVHQSMNREVAIKVLPDSVDVAKSGDRLVRFQREIQAAAKLNHPNIVRAYDAHQSDGICFLVMELIAGDDLAKVIREQGPLQVAEACSVACEIADALGAAHEAGIVHRDIKPSNILLTHAGQAKLLDMGLARVKQEAYEQSFTSSELSKFGMPLGTVAYMAPEQAIDASQATEAADIYSLGCTLHQLLTGSPPFESPSPIQVIVDHREKEPARLSDSHGIPVGLSEHLLRMMAKDPADRFSNMAEVHQALSPFRDGDFSSHSQQDPGKIALHKSKSSEPVSRSKIESSEEADVRTRFLGLSPARIASIAFGLAAIVLIWFLVSQFSGRKVQPLDFSKKEVSEKDIAKWVINEGGVAMANTPLGVQVMDDVNGIPEGSIAITDIALMEMEGAVIPTSAFLKSETLSSLSISDGHFLSRDLAKLSEARTLTSLSLSDCTFESDVLPIFSLTRLEDLQLISCDVSPEAIVQVSNLKSLIELSLCDCGILDSALPAIGKLKGLVWLDLAENDLTGAAVVNLATQLPSLAVVDFSYLPIRDEDLSVLANCKLTSLNLDYSEVTDVGVEQLSKIGTLQELYLEGTEVSSNALGAIAKLNDLQSLDLSQTKIDPMDLLALKGLKSLSQLVLNDIQVDEQSVEVLLQLKQIQFLDLRNSGLNKQLLMELAKLDLTELTVSASEISEATVEEYLEIATQCDVYLVD